MALQDGQGAMLDDWQENIAIMAANRTQGDERVMLHLGDRLWGVRGEVGVFFFWVLHLLARLKKDRLVLTHSLLCSCR